MKKIALVHITPNSIDPITRYLSQQSDCTCTQYLDGYLMGKIRQEGGISDGSMVRMLHLLGQACDDGADGIIITCTVFSAYVKAFNELFSVPIIAADDAMMQQAGALGGNTLLLCTFPGTKEVSTNLLRHYLDQSGKDYTLDTVVLEDALTHAKVFTSPKSAYERLQEILA